MNKRDLGRTGADVSVLSMGGLFVSKVGGDRASAIRAIHTALDCGVTLVDTAPGYYDSEEVVGLALRETSHPCMVSTKLGGRPTPFDARDPAALRSSFEASLRLLGRDRIDLLLIHEPDRPGQYDWWESRSPLRGPVLDLLLELKDRGLVQWIGLGGTTAYELPKLMESGLFDVVLTAFNYSLLWREAEIEVLPTAERLGMGVLAGSPLQQGALARRYDQDVASGAPWLSSPRRRQYQELYRFVDEVGMSLPELAVRFVLSDARVSTLLMGARNEAEVLANVAAVELGPLPMPILERLRTISDMVPFRPFEEPFGLPFTRTYRGPGRAT